MLLGLRPSFFCKYLVGGFVEVFERTTKSYQTVLKHCAKIHRLMYSCLGLE